MSDHSIKVTYERDSFRANLECHAPEDAVCRNQPDCDCDTYSGLEKDEQGWFHTAYNPEFDIDGPQDDTNLEEVEHRHTVRVKEGTECDYQAWVNADSPDECGPEKTFTVADFPVDLDWNGDYYTWAPKEAK